MYNNKSFYKQKKWQTKAVSDYSENQVWGGIVHDLNFKNLQIEDHRPKIPSLG